MNKKLLLVHFLIFVILEFFIFNFIHNQYNSLKSSYYENILGNFESNYKIAINSYEKLSLSLFDNNIKKDEVLEILSLSKEKDLKAQARENLYKKLLPFYHDLQSLGYSQLNFHLSNGESFLRFDTPKDFGENSFLNRKTVFYTNSNKLPVKGFEKGRGFNGFRYVYPLFFKGVHIGSVELAIPLKTVKDELEKISSSEHQILINSENKLNNTGDSSSFSAGEYYFEIPEEKSEKTKGAETIGNAIKHQAVEQLEQGKKFVLDVEIDNSQYLSLFYPIKEFGGKTKAYIVSHTSKDTLEILENDYMKNLLFSTFFVLFFFLLSYKLINNKNIAVRRSLEVLDKQEEIQKIFDSQKNITIMMNNSKFVKGNRAFYNYFGFNSFAEFEQSNRTVCSYFEGEELSVGINTLFHNESGWVEKVVNETVQEYKVYIKGKIFTVNGNKLDKESYIITFTDITDTINYQKKLELEVAIAVEKIEKQHQEILSSAKKAAMGDMIGIIAHQLKQPLSVISLYTEDIEMDYEDGKLNNQIMKEFTDTIKERVRFMSESIDNYRHFFNPNKKKSNFSGKKAVEKALEIIEVPLSSRGIDIETSLEETEIYGFEHDFIQVVMNIVINGKDVLVENCIAEPKIVIKLFKSSEKINLTISDNGGGISEENLPKIFNSYFSTKGEQGTGIGLNLAKMVIEDSFNGKISAKTVDNGAQFTIEI